MSSRNLPLLTGRLAITALLLLAVDACGRKGDPQPPPRKNPARTTDLRVEQSGQELILSLSYPTMTAGGLALPGVDRLELVQYTRPAPEFLEQPEGEVTAEDATAAEGEEAETTGEEIAAEEPTESTPSEPAAEEVTVEDLSAAQDEDVDPEDEGLAEPPPEADEGEGEGDGEEPIPEEPNPYLTVRVDPKEFDKLAETVLVLEGPDLEAAVVGGRIVVRLPLAAIATEPPVAYSFAVETSAGRLRSPQSTVASFVPLPPPPAPTDITTAIAARGVTLSWSGLQDESSIEGYRILRRPAQSPHYAEALATVEPGVSEYFDSSARFDNRYVYTITAVRMNTPLVESSLGEEQKVDYQDTFAPGAPSGLVALAESGRVRLLWDAGRERDIAGYLVFVSAGGSDPEQLTPEPITTAEFVHEGTVAGTTYVYTVRAVDGMGNQSEASSPATTRAP